MNVVSSLAEQSSLASNGLAALPPSTLHRRNYLIGLWAAGELGMHEADAERYAEEVASFGNRASRDEAVMNIVCADIAACNGDIGRATIRRRLHRIAEDAARRAEAEPVGAYLEAA